MKHKITRKLALYFTAVLLLFAVTVGSSFLTLFSKQSSEIYRADLEKRAVTIADTLSNYMNNNMNSFEKGNGHNCGQFVGFGAYLRLLDDIAMSDVWIVDQNAQTVSVGSGKNQIRYSELPQGAVALIAEVFEGKVSFSEGFSSLLESPSITVGAPIRSADGQVVAAVLLHTYAEKMTSTVQAGIKILCISLVLALVLSIAIAIVLSTHFARPLQEMEKITWQLSEGNYQVRTHIKQDDEIGSLAANIDILAQRLDEASKESSKLDQMRKDYISNISHELRTPVTVMRGSLEALCDGVVSTPAKVEEYHREMLAESIHLERMVNDLLELSRLQNSDYSIEKVQLNLPDVVEDAVRSIRHIAADKNVLVSCDNLVREFLMLGDYGRLRQMFMVVLENAVKFSYSGQQVSVQIASDEHSCTVLVTDNGTGISEMDLPHIFERFYKSADAKNAKGTGLGLAIAKQIADRHDIKLEVSSIPNQKTEFVFIAPV